MPEISRPVRCVLTWLAIFPLIVAVNFALSPLTGDWPQTAQFAATLTVVVPIAVYWALPGLTGLYLRLRPAPRQAAGQPGGAS